ncbi:hypothetical protein BDV93DRAFT_539946 [Ceratobasidium sp. AG-I]|nr:hypothetical protein BDV93DRAFT_539946 [Ceratobasidium sp. AG-I]
MFPRVRSVLYQLGIRRLSDKGTGVAHNLVAKIPPSPELSTLPPAPHLRSLQRKYAKRGTIVPILNRTPIKPNARVDPAHPVLTDKSFKAPFAANDYFDICAYPQPMLKRLGVIMTPTGKILPRPPREPDFPILKDRKRVKLACTVILPIKKTHKSSVVRVRLKRRVIEAIQLVVTRGANADPTGKKVVFDELEAGESKWLLRDWYYVFFPKPAVYNAPWPAVIKAARETLADIVRRGTEFSSSWNVTIAEREATAQARFSRREMRRVRMWRRQEQEVVIRGHIADDVGIRRKPEGLGVKKRSKQTGPGVGSTKMKALRAPVRNSFRDGQTSSSPAETSPAPRPMLRNEDIGPSAQQISKQPSATKSRPARVPSVPERKPVPTHRSTRTTIVNPPDQSVLGALRSQKGKSKP